jgi:septal ring factor EnvC (AmiA/AmiB activator)
MKTENKALIIKGIVVPDYKEPKGETYYTLVAQKYNEVQQIKARNSKALGEIDSIEKEIEALKKQIAAKESGADKYPLKKEIRELKKLVKPIETVAYTDIQKDINKIVNDSEIEIVEAKARKEFMKLHKQVEIYSKELDKAYVAAKKDINNFIAGYGSDSYYRMANVLNNRLKN